jgi:hypothetical protein
MTLKEAISEIIIDKAGMTSAYDTENLIRRIYKDFDQLLNERINYDERNHELNRSPSSTEETGFENT